METASVKLLSDTGIARRILRIKNRAMVRIRGVGFFGGYPLRSVGISALGITLGIFIEKLGTLSLRRLRAYEMF